MMGRLPSVSGETGASDPRGSHDIGRGDNMRKGVKKGTVGPRPGNRPVNGLKKPFAAGDLPAAPGSVFKEMIKDIGDVNDTDRPAIVHHRQSSVFVFYHPVQNRHKVLIHFCSNDVRAHYLVYFFVFEFPL